MALASQTLTKVDQLPPMDLAVIGMMAVAYGASAYECPLPHFGSEYRGRTVSVGADEYVVGYETVDIDGLPTICVSVWINRNRHVLKRAGHPLRQERYVIPLRALKRLTLHVEEAYAAL